MSERPSYIAVLERATMRIEPSENDGWMARLGFQSTYCCSSAWFPSLPAAKRFASEEYKFCQFPCRDDRPKRIAWKVIGGKL